MPSMLRVVGTGIAWNTVATIAVKVLGLVNVFLILRHLSVYDYGLVQLVLTVVSTIGGFLRPGLGSVLISDLARERGEGRLQRLMRLVTRQTRTKARSDPDADVSHQHCPGYPSHRGSRRRWCNKPDFASN